MFCIIVTMPLHPRGIMLKIIMVRCNVLTNTLPYILVRMSMLVFLLTQVLWYCNYCWYYWPVQVLQIV